MNTLNTLDKAYQSAAVEAKWYPAWVENGCFTGKADPSKEAFCIMIPPPNVTGVLTMGHVLNNTIQDVLIRRARQQGKAALWLPGTDHAGIATQTRVERELAKEGKTKYDLGRKAFLEHVAKWRDEHGGLRHFVRLGPFGPHFR
jgi:valyl-tRNA synthetase